MPDFISVEESKSLLDYWEKNNFNSFNIWIQKSKSILNQEWKTDRTADGRALFLGTFKLKLNPSVIN
jgi:hypothetical protein